MLYLWNLTSKRLKLTKDMNKKILGLGLLLAAVITFGSCKPKQSAYKSVYEAAKEKDMDETVVVTETVTTATVTPPSYSNESVRKEKIKPVYDSDASKLKAYSVVIAAMSVKPNAESLKQRMEAAGYNVILAQNEQGWYRVIIASCDTKEQAVAQKNEILSRFLSHDSIEALKAKYGIPFNDWWILQREY